MVWLGLESYSEFERLRGDSENRDPGRGRHLHDDGLQSSLSPSAVTETVEVSAKFHGGAFEYVRNSDFDARLFFKPSVGHVAYNQVNGFIGGPIKKILGAYAAAILAPRS
jgi:hypothetical protein